MKNFFKVLMLVVLFVGCSSEDSDAESVSVSNKTLSGKVFGEDFTAKGGKAFTSGDKIAIKITNIQAGCSSNAFDYEYHISTLIENKAGISTNANVVFNKKGEIAPINVFGSTVVVESITDSQIVVKIKSESGDDNYVEGMFTVPYCK